MLRTICILAIGLLATASASIGPTVADFNKLRAEKGESCPPIRNLQCTVLGDPTEMKCSWQERFKGKSWTRSEALIAVDGGQWVWLDGGPRCSALPQR